MPSGMKTNRNVAISTCRDKILKGLQLSRQEEREVIHQIKLLRGRDKRGTPLGLYKTWKNMMYRCYNPKDANFKYYGAKGIAVDSSWHSLANFLEDMSEGWSPGMQLDRIDRRGGYCRENCQWLSASEHSRKTGAERSGREAKVVDVSSLFSELDAL